MGRDRERGGIARRGVARGSVARVGVVRVGVARIGLGERSTSIPAQGLHTCIIRWNVHRIWISINLAQSILGMTAYLHIKMAYMY